MTTATQSSTATATDTYTKLRDCTWGVRVSGAAQVGQLVTVTKRSGERKTETVAAVLWTGVARDGRHASLVTISASRAARHGGRGVWNGCSCGALELPEGGLSANACASCRFDEYDC